MAHADKVRDAERELVEACLREYEALNRWDAAHSRRPRLEQGEMDALEKLCDATQTHTYALCRALIALRASGCPRCGGRGMSFPLISDGFGYAMGCPDCKEGFVK